MPFVRRQSRPRCPAHEDRQLPRRGRSRPRQQFREEYATLPNVVKAEDMPWERSPDGLIKHLVHHKMNTRECCVEAYMQFLKDGERSGKHRHMWEELFFVVEGSGYDLHWDLKFDCLEAFEWEWAESRSKYEWTARRFHLRPAVHDAPALRQCRGEECRIIVICNRIVKDMGFDWFDQVEKRAGILSRHSGSREAAFRNPYPQVVQTLRGPWIWIPDLRFARPAMTSATPV